MGFDEVLGRGIVEVDEEEGRVTTTTKKKRITLPQPPQHLYYL
jgi:hypothetical protein